MKPLSENVLERVSERISRQLGWHFPRERWHELEAGLRAAAAASPDMPAEAALERLLAGPLSRHDIETLASELSVGETYFFRDLRSYDFLREQALPELIRRGEVGDRRLRLWSAGCCTGEEPYSLAILLDRFFPELRSWSVTILATDVNPRFLRRATEGVFGEWSFRDAPSWLRQTYFTPLAGNRHQVLPRIRQRVTFAYLNLAEDPFPSLTNGTNAIDLILCRNVLMYFTPERVRAAIDGFHRALRDPGWLIVSAAETSSQFSSAFASVQFDGATFYRKTSASAPSSAAPLPAPPVLPPPPFVPSPPSPAAPDFGRDLAAAEPAPLPTAHEKALSFFESGDYAAAVQALQADAAQPGTPATHLALLARACANLGDLAAARGWTERALAADKLDASLHYLQALIAQEQGELADTSGALRRTLYLDPDFVLAHFAVGNLALRQGRRADALRHFSHALQLLERRPAAEVLPYSDGLSSGRLKEVIESALLEVRAA